MQESTARRRRNRASSRQSSLPSQCLSLGNRNPVSVGRGGRDTVSGTRHREGVSCERRSGGTHGCARRRELHHSSAGGWTRLILVMWAGRAVKNDTGDGEEWEGEPGQPQAWACRVSTNIPVQSPSLPHLLLGPQSGWSQPRIWRSSSTCSNSCWAILHQGADMEGL